MTDAFADDLPTELTRVLRNVEGVHTVYATRPVVPTVLASVAEAVRREPVGMHQVSVQGSGADIRITANIGVFEGEPAPDVCRRAHDAIVDHIVGRGAPQPAAVTIRIGRVG